LTWQRSSRRIKNCILRSFVIAYFYFIIIIKVIKTKKRDMSDMKRTRNILIYKASI
jgi:hypothetical protein